MLIRSAWIAFSIVCLSAAASNAQQPLEKFQVLFNGTNLDGWSGDPSLWSVSQGAIVGQTTEQNPIKGNTFLVWQGGEVADFEFRCKVRFEGNNSGVQYRSETVGGNSHALQGYQADLHENQNYFGMMYGERYAGRGIIAQRGQKLLIDSDGSKKELEKLPKSERLVAGDWNDLRIIAVGNRMIHQINGTTTIDLTDNHPSARTSGLLGLQLHRGPAMKVEFRNLLLRSLTPEQGKAAIDGLASNARRSSNTKEIITQPGFEVDLVHQVPHDTEGSWVCLTKDADGGFYASDQADKGLFHITFDDAGVCVEKLDIRDPDRGDLLSGAQGLLWAFDSLWMHRNGGHLYRITDANRDGTLDTAEIYPSQTGGGEHGNHALILSEDGEGIYMVGGNHAARQPTKLSRIQSWNEDILLPRMWDARGHARGRMAPGGWVTLLDLSTKEQELFCAGFRNQYDVALNRFGDMFTFDADMEWDLGLPWYRPTRICHVVSGGDYGWRSGTGKWPSYYEDSLPSSVDIGPGSPTGVVFGIGAKFPTRYQDAMFALDWTFGTIYAVHLEADGAGYQGEKEPFLYGTPLPVTDVVIGKDGHLYFTVGGRGAESALYRVRYVGDESTAAPSGDPAETARNQRRVLESFHGRTDPSAVATAWPALKSPDRFLRSAARVAVESQNPNEWAGRLFTETDPQTIITASVALARTGSSEHLSPLLEILATLDAKQLPEHQWLGLLRAYQLAFIRLGNPSEEERSDLIEKFDSLFPSQSSNVNRELVQLLVYLRSPSVVAKTMELIAKGSEPNIPDWQELASRSERYGGTIRKMLENPPPATEIDYAFALRNAHIGWNLERRRDYFEFLNQAAKASGGASYPGYLTNIRNEALTTATNEERMALQDITGEDFNPVPDFEIFPLQRSLNEDAENGSAKKWTVDEALGAVRGEPDFERGRSVFFAAECGKCHRLAGLGGGVGPDLTSIPNKFDQRYVIEAMVNPSKDISDQYGSTKVLLDDGTIVTGIVVDKDTCLEIYPQEVTDKPIVVSKDEIEWMEPSKVSQMPEGLLDRLTEQEIRDLVGYLMSGGVPK